MTALMPMEDRQDAGTISVVCPVYNTAPALIAEAARSVLSEAAETVGELILVDDASGRAETRAALERLATEDGRIRLIRLERNCGAGAARNAGIAVARGSWIGFVDADDAWLPGRGEVLRAVLAAAPDAGWISGAYSLLMPSGAREDLPPFSAETDLFSPVASGISRAEGRALTVRLLQSFCVHLGPTLIRATLLRDLGGFHPRVRIGEDTLLFLLLSTVAPLHYVSRALYLQRMDHGSVTTSATMLADGNSRMLRAARRDPRLASVRRQIRWALYSAEKQLAASNLAHGARLRALGLALRAWSVDPRELGDLVRFLHLLTVPQAGLRDAIRHYTPSKVIDIRVPP